MPYLLKLCALLQIILVGSEAKRFSPPLLTITLTTITAFLNLTKFLKVRATYLPLFLKQNNSIKPTLLIAKMSLILL